MLMNADKTKTPNGRGTVMQYPVPVVRLIIKNNEGMVLLLQRANSAYSQGSWCLPGGKIDYNQTIEQTVAKELAEETALTAVSSKFLFYQDSLPLAEGKMHCINLYFECTVSGDIVLNEESGEYAWIRKEDVLKYDITFRNDEALLRYWGERR
jgi:8-oxo-dGTP diphosphatase